MQYLTYIITNSFSTNVLDQNVQTYLALMLWVFWTSQITCLFVAGVRKNFSDYKTIKKTFLHWDNVLKS